MLSYSSSNDIKEKRVRRVPPDVYDRAKEYARILRLLKCHIMLLFYSTLKHPIFL